jgi:uncharacterized membrane protein HdeD (DUF308 family)
MSASPALSARTIQFARAGLAAIAGLMITFSTDHSAQVGLAVFGGFGIASALVLIVGACFSAPPGGRWPFALLGANYLIAGMVASLSTLRSTMTFFALITTWAIVTGLVELIAGLVARKRGQDGSRDFITLAVFALLLGVALLLIPATFSLDYTVDSDSFTLTGIILGVGAFGAWAWINAVYLAIAGFTPGRVPVLTEALADGAERQRSTV